MHGSHAAESTTICAQDEWAPVAMGFAMSRLRNRTDDLLISYATVLRMTKAGDLHAIRVGREFRYLRSEIEAMMRQPARPATDTDEAATG